MAAMRKTGKYMARRRSVTGQNRGVTRLVVCGIVLALILVCKTLFPDQIGAFAQSISQIVGRNANFSEAFASVGRAMSGEEDVGQSLQDAFHAVFGPSEIQAEGEAEDSAITESVSKSVNLSADTEKVYENTSDEKELSDPLGGYAMQSLPENASLEQRNLGFSCTTPVVGVLSSAFGWRDHPTEGGTRFHYGIDLAAETGSEIVAFADGEVFAVGESSTLGKYIILTHSGGYKTLYAHCSEIVVKSGSVLMGECIARVGESGDATGPHLHFELQNGTLYLNPIYYIAVG